MASDVTDIGEVDVSVFNVSYSISMDFPVDVTGQVGDLAFVSFL
jgi:hypothetical protein